MENSRIDKVPPTLLSSIPNFRDVGRTINLLNGSPILREGLLFRSARPDDASPSDRSALTTTYHIKSIIDLRSTTEHVDQAKKRGAAVQASALASRTDEKAMDVVKIDGIEYYEINLNGGAFAASLLWKLQWMSLATFLSLMMSGYRNKAISILGREVMGPRGLIGLGQDTLDHSTKELHRIFFLLADRANYPFLIHCTQGKDRTGLVVVLLLLLLDVPIDCILPDYLASERQLESERSSRLIEIKQVGLGEEFAGCPNGFVEGIVHHIDGVYGGLNAYFQKVGIDEATQSRIRGNMRTSL